MGACLVDCRDGTFFNLVGWWVDGSDLIVCCESKFFYIFACVLDSFLVLIIVDSCVPGCVWVYLPVCEHGNSSVERYLGR